MDISVSIRNTIDTLAKRPSVQHGQAEIAIHDVKSHDGGKEAAGDRIQKTVDTLNQAAANVDARVSFDYSKETKRVVMRIVDPDTNEVVRQVPSQEMIRLLERINEVTGLLIDETR